MALRKREVKESTPGDGTDESKMSIKEVFTVPNLDGDWGNIGLLLFLYTLQGVPLGLSASIPMILQNRGATYTQQAEFSFVQWPFSLKLLWAPIVDAIYSLQYGRRKTWLIPTQYLIGFFMLFLSYNIEDWIGTENTLPQIGFLTTIFFFLNFMAATQDIAVDGWALTMLKKCNVGYASTCNSVGQTIGFFLGYVLFLSLESAEFCNKYLRSVPQTTGIVTLAWFFSFWGIIFLVTTSFVAFYKTEEEAMDSEHESVHEQSVQSAYSNLMTLIKMPAIKTLALVLLTCKVGFSATDSVLSLKLVEAGISKEKLGLMAIPLIPVQIGLPLIISKYTNGPRPWDIFLKFVPARILFGLVAAGAVWVTPRIVSNNEIPTYFYISLILLYAVHQVCVYSMFVALMAFFNKVSDPAVGGTYMTLLNTLCNLGGNWPQTLALWCIDPLTLRACVSKTVFQTHALDDNFCRNSYEKEVCVKQGGTCVTTFDGFYVETFLCVVIGFLWLRWGRKKIYYLQNLTANSWKIPKKSDR